MFLFGTFVGGIIWMLAIKGAAALFSVSSGWGAAYLIGCAAAFFAINFAFLRRGP